MYLGLSTLIELEEDAGTGKKSAKLLNISFLIVFFTVHTRFKEFQLNKCEFYLINEHYLVKFKLILSDIFVVSIANYFP